MTRNVISLTFDPAVPTLLPAGRRDRQAGRARARLRREARHRRLPAPGLLARDAGRPRRVLDLAADGGAPVADGHDLDRAERAEPAALLAAAVHLARANASGAVVLPRPGDDVRHAQDGERGASRSVGVGLSPRGNDMCRAASNVSTSPVRFLQSLGAAMRAAGGTGRSWTRSASTRTRSSTRTGRRRATAGPTSAWRTWTGSSRRSGTRSTGPRSRRSSRGLDVYLDELGWQTESIGEPYTGAENVGVVDELTQGGTTPSRSAWPPATRRWRR